jgi:hypothetical protein
MSKRLEQTLYQEDTPRWQISTRKGAHQCSSLGKCKATMTCHDTPGWLSYLTKAWRCQVPRVLEVTGTVPHCWQECDSTTVLQRSWAASHVLTTRPSPPIPHISPGEKLTPTEKPVRELYSSSLQNCQNLEATQMSITGWIIKPNFIYSGDCLSTTSGWLSRGLSKSC